MPCPLSTPMHHTLGCRQAGARANDRSHVRPAMKTAPAAVMLLHDAVLESYTNGPSGDNGRKDVPHVAARTRCYVEPRSTPRTQRRLAERHGAIAPDRPYTSHWPIAPDAGSGLFDLSSHQ